MSYEIRQYTDEEGKLVTARIPVDSKTLVPDTENIRFFGTYTVPHPQMGQMRLEFEFPKDWELGKCFEEFKAEAEKDFKILQEQAQKEATTPKIWTPGTGNAGGLVVPK